MTLKVFDLSALFEHSLLNNLTSQYQIATLGAFPELRLRGGIVQILVLLDPTTSLLLATQSLLTDTLNQLCW